MIELYIKEAKARERERATAGAREERLRIVRTLENWLGEEKVNALELVSEGAQWFVTFQVPHAWLPWKRTLEVRRNGNGHGLEVMRAGQWSGHLTYDGDEFLVAVGALR